MEKSNEAFERMSKVELRAFLKKRGISCSRRTGKRELHSLASEAATAGIPVHVVQLCQRAGEDSHHKRRKRRRVAAIGDISEQDFKARKVDWKVDFEQKDGIKNPARDDVSLGEKSNKESCPSKKEHTAPDCRPYCSSRKSKKSEDLGEYKPLKKVTHTVDEVRKQIICSCEGEHDPGIQLLTPKLTSPLSIAQLVADFHSANLDNIFQYLREKTSLADRRFFRDLDQKNTDWFQARVGRITASLAGDVLALRDSSEGKYLIRRIMGTAYMFSSASTDYGHRHEAIARKLYVKQMSGCHDAFACETTGLHIMEELPFLGASPDGLVTCSCHGQRLLEIKCPSKHKSIRAKNIPKLDSSYHLEKRDGHLCLKTTSKWFYQVQFQMGVIGMRVCDLVVYTRCGIEVIPISFDEAVWNKLKAKAIHVFCQRILPLL